MARSLRSRAPAPPGAAGGADALVAAPLGGSRSEAVRRLQMGAVGVVAVLMLIGLASLIKDRATETDNAAVAGAAATTAAAVSTAAADPLAEAGVVPEIPGSSPTASGSATAVAPAPSAPAARPASPAQPGAR